VCACRMPEERVFLGEAIGKFYRIVYPRL
jgi:hypothetical protein